jgi:two-component system, cell cycle sensor histidine kinase and response regulator CckA
MASVGNRATILLVDDDEALRRFVWRILLEQGFHVIQASDGAEALEAASAYDQTIDLVLTDVIMPKVNGLALARGLLQERPGIRVLYMSGYMEKSMLLAKHPESVLLQKPFTPATLIAAVRQVLASEDQP